MASHLRLAGNRLAGESSPYLLQHAHNPVHWFPWSDEAFERARREDKPIFLSIGYSTCHWCHVMERESFEDEATARILNEHFISIKVDREERPDVDRIYMLFVQATTGSGGWPMSVWLTPERKPFYGGTYFPPNRRYGRPGFADLLLEIARAWQQDHERVRASSDSVLEQLQALSVRSAADNGELDQDLFQSVYWSLRRSFDAEQGGFGAAPKFPRPAALLYLLRFHAAEQAAGRVSEALEMVELTLRKMAAGGINDHLAGGFHRYSVDRDWFVPHFEKMLYDQAQLVTAYLEAFQSTGDRVFADVARRTLGYVLAEMRDEAGGFYSAEDADSADPANPAAKREGAYYVWRAAEIGQVLAPELAQLVSAYFGVLPEGNVHEDAHGEFSGQNILAQRLSLGEMAATFLLTPENAAARLDEARAALLQYRRRRPRPHLDDKVLVCWNSLLISALAQASLVLDDRTYLEAGRAAFGFLRRSLYDATNGRLLRRYREGSAGIPAPFEDYALFAQASLDLFAATAEADFLELAMQLVDRVFPEFADPIEGGYFSSPPGDATLIMRLKDEYDGAEPSANSVAAAVLLRLGAITGRAHYREAAERVLRAFASQLRRQPGAAPLLAAAVGVWLAPPEHVILLGHAQTDQLRAHAAAQARPYRPHAVVLTLDDDQLRRLKPLCPFLSTFERTSAITLYHCHHFACQLPQAVLE